MIYKPGDKVKVVANHAGHRVAIGTLGVIKSVPYTHDDVGLYQYYLEGRSPTFYGKDLIAVTRELRREGVSASITKLTTELEALNEEYANLILYATDEDEEVAIVKNILNAVGKSQDESIKMALDYFKGRK